MDTKVAIQNNFGQIGQFGNKKGVFNTKTVITPKVAKISGVKLGGIKKK